MRKCAEVRLGDGDFFGFKTLSENMGSECDASKPHWATLSADSVVLSCSRMRIEQQTLTRPIKLKMLKQMGFSFLKTSESESNGTALSIVVSDCFSRS